MLARFFNNSEGRKPFRFCNHWATREKFIDIVRDKWQTQVPGYISFQITEKLKCLKTKLKAAFHLDLENEVHKAEVELLFIQGQFHLYLLDETLACRE